VKTVAAGRCEVTRQTQEGVKGCETGATVGTGPKSISSGRKRCSEIDPRIWIHRGFRNCAASTEWDGNAFVCELLLAGRCSASTSASDGTSAQYGFLQATWWWRRAQLYR
jgi:hypothetical protein